MTGTGSATAIFKAAASVGGTDRPMAEELALQGGADAVAGTYGENSIPTVEDIQDWSRRP
jgi:hypothetical protein